jgi:hypothetical protein
VRQRTDWRQRLKHDPGFGPCLVLHPADQLSAPGRTTMLYTIAVVLLVLWVLGLVTSYTAGGLLHILLVLAVIVIVFQLISGRRVG